MSHFPDFSSDENFSDDDDYYDFKERVKNLNKNPGLTSNGNVQDNKELEKQNRMKSLFYALSGNNINIVREELDNGLDVNIDLESGWTPILLSASVGNPAITIELLNRGADVNASRDGCTALMMACNCPKNTSPYEDSLMVIEKLVEHGANVRAQNRKRMNALMFAANSGNLPAVKFLLPLSDKDVEDNQKWTALFWAVNDNHVEVVRYLLQEGFSYTNVDVRNNTPLDLAKMNGFEKIIGLFPTDDNDVSHIIDKYAFTCASNFENLKKGERPKFYLEICNILSGLRNESLVKLFLDKRVGLSEFLCLTEEDLKQIGVGLPYQRYRILTGLHRFHKQPYHPKSLLVVPLNDVYSNVDVATQIVSAIKQLIAMEASIKYIKNNYKDTMDSSELKTISENIKNLRSKIRVMKIITGRILEKTNQWDLCIKPADLITSKSRRRKTPWNKIVISLSVVSLLVYKFLK